MNILTLRRLARHSVPFQRIAHRVNLAVFLPEAKRQQYQQNRGKFDQGCKDEAYVR